MTLPQALQRLRTDRTSGATTLGESAINIVEEFISMQGPQQPQDLSAALEKLVEEILLAQPSMAVMLNLAQCVLEACLEDTAFPGMKQRVQQALSEFRRTLRQSMDALCRQAMEILPPHATVLTYSNSTTVTEVLHHARAQGHLDRVLLSEARPAYDGRQLARSLAEAGVTIDYSIDMGLFARLREADLVVLGADAVFPGYFLNKIGTHALVELARVRNVPCFALSTANKFLPTAATRLLRVSKHPGDEVWPESAWGVRVHNQYFEEIPLSLLHGVVSDHGIHSPEEVRIILDQRPLPLALLRLGREPKAPGSISRKILAQMDGPTPGYVTLLVEAEIEAGVTVARHKHPGIESGYVLEGGLDLPVEGQPIRALKPGDGFQVPAETPHAGGKNGDKKTRVLVTYVVEKGKPLASPA